MVCYGLVSEWWGHAGGGWGALHVLPPLWNSWYFHHVDALQHSWTLVLLRLLWTAFGSVCEQLGLEQTSRDKKQILPSVIEEKSSDVAQSPCIKLNDQTTAVYLSRDDVKSLPMNTCLCCLIVTNRAVATRPPRSVAQPKLPFPALECQPFGWTAYEYCTRVCVKPRTNTFHASLGVSLFTTVAFTLVAQGGQTQKHPLCPAGKNNNPELPQSISRTFFLICMKTLQWK